MTQTVLCIVTALITLFAPIFNWTATPSVPAQGLIKESEPTADNLRVFDRVDGVNDSVFYIARPNEKKNRTVNAADFGLNENNEDNYPAFCSAIAYCRENPNTRLVVSGGKYYFRTNREIVLDGLKNTIIDADGAQFVFEHPNYFRITDCDCIEFRGLSITWNLNASRLGSIVKVKKVNRIKHSFEIEFTELDEVSEDIPIMAFTQYDAKTLTPGVSRNFKENYVYQHPDIIKSVTKTKSNILKITHNGDLDDFRNGDVFLLRHHVYDGNAFNVFKTSNITFSGVKIYAAAGMGWLIENRTERFQLLDCVIGLDPEHVNDHRISATADGVHIANTNGKFRISGCDFSFMGDDDVNVHDNLLSVTEVVDKNTVEYYTNANNLAVGDTVIFNSERFSDLDFSAKVTAMNAETITFDRDLPETVGKGCIIYNGSIDGGNYVISNNYFHENRARGLLLQSDNGLCENNTFYKTMANPIKIIMDISSGLWLEGSGVNTLTVRNNTFKECNIVKWSSQIDISSNIDGNSADCALFYNIVIENNRFENFQGDLLRASDVSNLSFCGNTTDNREGKITNGRGNIKINSECSKVTVKGNKFRPSARAPFQGRIKFKSIKSVL